MEAQHLLLGSRQVTDLLVQLTFCFALQCDLFGRERFVGRDRICHDVQGYHHAPMRLAEMIGHFVAGDLA
jgi:hypothetical protein